MEVVCEETFYLGMCRTKSGAVNDSLCRECFVAKANTIVSDLRTQLASAQQTIEEQGVTIQDLNSELLDRGMLIVNASAYLRVARKENIDLENIKLGVRRALEILSTTPKQTGEEGG